MAGEQSDNAAGGNGGEKSKFKLLKRDPREFSEGSWRLASVDEVEVDIEKIKVEGILDSQDSARLLDGFIYNGEVKKRYAPHKIHHMLAIDTKTTRPDPLDGSIPKDLYPSIIPDHHDRRKAALFLSCEDKNTEVILWVLQNLSKESKKEDKFNRLRKSLETTLSGDRTVLHYAVDQPYFEQYALKIAELLWHDFGSSGQDLVIAKDKQERTALHYAAYHGYSNLCKFLIKDCELGIDDKDGEGENVLQIAVDRNNCELMTDIYKWYKKLTVNSSADSRNKTQAISSQNSKEKTPLHEVICLPDRRGKTLLHKAAVNGKKQIVKYLVECLREQTPDGSCVSDFVRQADMYGQTALLEAARKGHIQVVKYLLKKGSRPLHERNADGKTALHYAVQLDLKNAKELINLLTDKMSDEEKYLLLWASATGIGTAAESTRYPTIREHLETKIPDREKKTPLLWRMVILGHLDMALELVNRGANVQEIKDLRKKTKLDDPQDKHVNDFLNHIHKRPKRESDQPATEDSLGRNVFSEGLAALFLNPFVKSPVTVGIFGDWGMGKSSIMRQTEILLLKEASKLAFPDLLKVGGIPGSKPFGTPQNCHYKKLRLAATSLRQGKGVVDLLNNYKENDEKVYRALALMDRKQMFGKEHPLAKIPSIVTVSYNAWHYQTPIEAWAGLAVRITQGIEETMTTAQRIRVSCKYSWKRERGKIWLQLILPCLLTLVSAGVVAWVAWSVLKRSDFMEKQAIQYGSVSLSIMIVVWTVVRQFLSVIKPISDQLMGYVRWNDHSGNLGYQQKVIDDIQYLNTEIREEPCWAWKFMAWIWNLLHLRLCGDTVEDTWIPKSHSASPGEDDLRIIVFVDDLDRCEDDVILQVLSAVNLVLAACKIDVILGVDKTMLARAIANKIGDKVENVDDKAKHVEDLAEKYLSKMIQLPLALQDPDKTGTKNFLQQLVGPDFEDEYTHSNVHKSQSSAGSAEIYEETKKGGQAGGTQGDVVLSVENSRNPPKRPAGFFSKVREFFCSGAGDSEDVQKKQSGNLTLLQSHMPNLSKKEQQALFALWERATGTRRLPREWKRFLMYHRLAWNILSKKEEIKTLTWWQVQLVVWIFCCWEWKHQINDIIQNWQRIVCVERTTQVINEDEGPSLKTIVDHYKDKIWSQTHGENEEKPSENADWMALSDTLREYDVSMKAIHCFQEFRLHCQVGRLPLGNQLQDNLEDKSVTTSTEA